MLYVSSHALSALQEQKSSLILFLAAEECNRGRRDNSRMSVRSFTSIRKSIKSSFIKSDGLHGVIWHTWFFMCLAATKFGFIMSGFTARWSLDGNSMPSKLFSYLNSQISIPCRVLENLFTALKLTRLTRTTHMSLPSVHIYAGSSFFTENKISSSSRYYFYSPPRDGLHVCANLLLFSTRSSATFIHDVSSFFIRFYGNERRLSLTRFYGKFVGKFARNLKEKHFWIGNKRFES